MDGLLTAVKTISTADRRGVDTIGETVSQKTSQGQLHESVASSGEQCTIRTPQEAQKCLRSGPTDSQLLQVIRFLDPRNAAQTGYDIRDPEPLNISILNSLIDVAVNERWTKIENEHKVYVAQKHGRSSKAIILRCLTSVSGIGALNTNLRTSLDKITTQQGNVGSGMQLILRDTLIVLSHILLKPSLLLEIYQNLTETSSPARRRLAWSQLLSFLASGRVLSTASEVLATVKDGDIPTSVRWLGDGRRYASWIGRSIVPMAMVLEDGASEGWGCLAKFSQRSLSLGYTSKPCLMPKVPYS